MSARRTKSGPMWMADFLLKPTGSRAPVIRLGLAAGCLMLTSSCLAPQSIEEETSVRKPPMIDTKTIAPEGTVVCFDSTTTQTTFRATVYPKDEFGLDVRWFVDYDFSLKGKHSIDSQSNIPVGSTDAVQVELDQAALGSVPINSVHTVEVVVATAFVNGNEYPWNRSVGKDNYSTSYKWVVRWEERCSPQ